MNWSLKFKSAVLLPEPHHREVCVRFSWSICGDLWLVYESVCKL